jgi:hypothetical protein
MVYRKSSGEKISGKSWVLRNVWNTRKGFERGVKRVMEDALWTQRLRSRLEPGKRRHEFQTDHGFRKWFKTRCEIAGMKPINIEKLMGHSVGISDWYYRATEHELLEDYRKAIDVLTISKESHLQTQVDYLNARTKEGEAVHSKLEERIQEIQLLKQNDLMKADVIASLADRLQDLVLEVQNLKKHKR